MYKETGLVLSWLCGSAVNEGQPSGSLESAASSEERFDKLTAGYGLLPRIDYWVFLFFLFLNFCENCINEFLAPKPSHALPTLKTTSLVSLCGGVLKTDHLEPDRLSGRLSLGRPLNACSSSSRSGPCEIFPFMLACQLARPLFTSC